MAISVIRGLIVREVNVGEADKIVTVLAKNIGLVDLSAKGARRTRGMLSAGTSLFTYADFTVKTGAKHSFLSQADIIDSFYNLTSDLDALAYATYIAELISKVCYENIPADNVLHLAINIYKRLADNKIKPKLAGVIFELKLLQYNGFMPVLDSCVRCGKPHNYYMSAFGVMCNECAKLEPNRKLMTSAQLYTMQYIFAFEPPKLFVFDIDDSILTPLAEITSKLMDEHFNLTLKSKKFINSLNIY
jgi:DNA repair protein RecO (recombination protein O)